MQIYGVEALVRLFSYFIFIYLSFRALQSLKVEELFRKGRYSEIRLFYLLASIALGYSVGSFFGEMITLFRNFIMTFMG